MDGEAELRQTPSPCTILGPPLAENANYPPSHIHTDRYIERTPLGAHVATYGKEGTSEGLLLEKKRSWS